MSFVPDLLTRLTIPPPLPVLGQEHVALDLEFLDRIHREQHAGRVEPRAPAFHAVDEITIAVAAPARHVDREIRAARLVGDRSPTRVVRWRDARRDGGKLHEVAAVEREGNDTLTLDDLAERGGF